MNTAIEASSNPPARRPIPNAQRADRVLKTAAASWLITAVFGQLIFALYVAGFYGRAAVQGRFDVWNKILPHGYVAGDMFGNLMVGLHLLFTVLIIAGGALQLVPRVRRLAPAAHRINGRLYLLLAAVLSTTGLLMLWTRGSTGGFWQHVAISINGLLILGFAAMAWRNARARAFEAHRRWALRLFLAVSGVWFFRVGLMLWIVANRGPVGFDPQTFQGPFLIFLTFAQYLIPLALLELYFHAQRGGPAWRGVMAGILGVLTLATAGGIAAASAILWLPRI